MAQAVWRSGGPIWERKIDDITGVGTRLGPLRPRRHPTNLLRFLRQTGVGNLGQRNLDQLDMSENALQLGQPPRTLHRQRYWEEDRYLSFSVVAMMQGPKKPRLVTDFGVFRLFSVLTWVLTVLSQAASGISSERTT